MSVVQVQKFSGAVGEETVELPQVQPVEHGHCRSHAHRCATTAAGCVVQTSENCEGPAVAVHLNVVVVLLCRSSSVFVHSWTRSLTCPLCSTLLLRTVKVPQIQFIDFVVVEAELEYIIMRQSTEAFGSFSVPWACSRCSHLGKWCIILLLLVSGSLSSVSGCCLWNTEHWIFREMTLSVAQCLV